VEAQATFDPGLAVRAWLGASQQLARAASGDFASRIRIRIAQIILDLVRSNQVAFFETKGNAGAFAEQG